MAVNRQHVQQFLIKALMASGSVAALIALALLLQSLGLVFPSTQNAAATPLAVTQGYPAYNAGYPMPDTCAEYNTDYIGLQKFCNPGITGVGLLSVFSAHVSGSLSSGHTSLLKATKGTQASPVYYYTTGQICQDNGPKYPPSNCAWGHITDPCTAAQVGQTRTEAVGQTTCTLIQNFTSYPLSYQRESVGNVVMTDGNTPVTLEWSCQNSQQYYTEYCTSWAPFSGTCWNHAGTWSGTQYYASSATGGGFSTGGALIGSATVTPNETTTYSLTCGGYRNTLNQSEDVTKTCGTRQVVTGSSCSKWGCSYTYATVPYCELHGPSGGTFSALHNGIADSSSFQKPSYVTVMVPNAPACTLNSVTPVPFGTETTLTYVMATGAAANTKLLISADGPDGFETFLDTSTGANIVNANGNAKISTAQSKFGGSSAYFDGNGDYLSIPDSPYLEPEASDFTIDFWFRPNTVANIWGTPYRKGNYGDVGLVLYQYGSNLYLYMGSGGSWSIAYGRTAASGLSANTWYHFALVRSGTTFTTYLNGVQTDTFTSASSITNNSGLHYIGNDALNYYPYSGYIEEFRYSDTALWASNFTPPDAACPGGCPGQPTSASISPSPGVVSIAPQPYNILITKDTTFQMTVSNTAGISTCATLAAIDPASCPANSTASSGTCVCNSGYSMNSSYQCVTTDLCSNIPGVQSSVPANCSAVGDGTCTPDAGYVISGSQCVLGSISFTATPSRVRPNNQTELRWNVSGMASCGVTDKNSVVVAAQNATNGADGAHSLFINVTENNTYTLLCIPTSGGSESRSVNVGVVPTFIER